MRLPLTRNRYSYQWLIIALIYLAVACPALPSDEPENLLLFSNGKPQLPIFAGSIDQPGKDLKYYLEKMTGARFDVMPAVKGQHGIYVGLIGDFPWLDLKGVDQLGPEGFIIRSDGRNLYLIGTESSGVQHAVATFLRQLGCRWFFPGDAWEVIPSQKTIQGKWDLIQHPSFPTQRRIWYGFGANAKNKRDLLHWERMNRMGGAIKISIGHTWHGLNPERDFQNHPEWFAWVEGQRQSSKPCYSHPQVLQTAIEYALTQAGRGQQMISMTPPDGLGYCECERCISVFQGAEPKRIHRSLFAERPDGVLVNVTSETLFAFINKIAESVSEKYPKVFIGCYAYSAYSHPPSFKLHPNVYLQTTTAFRRTPQTLEEQLEAYGRKASQVGIRDYYSVFQWDWDYPNPGAFTPDVIRQKLKSYRNFGVTAINAEASNNWAARGLSYYVASELMWDGDVDINQLIGDFYTKAFGPAALPMQRYYARWYGPGVVVLADDKPLPEHQLLVQENTFNIEALKAAYLDLSEAITLVGKDSQYRKRIDQIRMYVHYLFLRYQVHMAEGAGDQKLLRDAIQAETQFGGRLSDTNMIHSRALLGKAYFRRFRKHTEWLEKIPEASQANRGWRAVGVPPTPQEVDVIWIQDLKALKIH